ncbi:MAG: hypothetical protein CSB44_07405 [Gammaproteobacteria bacterium]|nr:MAG: hypothetical protein CSB44_07405 [Gammaproteobacteria bacterium]
MISSRRWPSRLPRNRSVNSGQCLPAPFAPSAPPSSQAAPAASTPPTPPRTPWTPWTPWTPPTASTPPRTRPTPPTVSADEAAEALPSRLAIDIAMPLTAIWPSGLKRSQVEERSTTPRSSPLAGWMMGQA